MAHLNAALQYVCFSSPRQDYWYPLALDWGAIRVEEVDQSAFWVYLFYLVASLLACVCIAIFLPLWLCILTVSAFVCLVTWPFFKLNRFWKSRPAKTRADSLFASHRPDVDLNSLRASGSSPAGSSPEKESPSMTRSPVPSAISRRLSIRSPQMTLVSHLNPTTASLLLVYRLKILHPRPRSAMPAPTLSQSVIAFAVKKQSTIVPSTSGTWLSLGPSAPLRSVLSKLSQMPPFPMKIGSIPSMPSRVQLSTERDLSPWTSSLDLV